MKIPRFRLKKNSGKIRNPGRNQTFLYYYIGIVLRKGCAIFASKVPERLICCHFFTPTAKANERNDVDISRSSGLVSRIAERSGVLCE